MGKSKIEWLKGSDGSQGYSINPVKGLCPMHCKTPEGYEYCYAAGERGFYKRFKWNSEIRYEQSVLRYEYEDTFPDGAKVFVGSTMELFGDWVKPEWMDNILIYCKYHPFVTFIFLTKCPQNLPREFPPNCWVGASVTNHEQLIKAQVHLAEIEAGVRFVSVEPFLSELETLVEGFWLGLFEVAEWGIFGSQTQPTKHPKFEAVKLAIECADWNKRPVFVKEPMASHFGIRRQEFPVGVKQ